MGRDRAGLTNGAESRNRPGRTRCSRGLYGPIAYVDGRGGAIQQFDKIVGELGPRVSSSSIYLTNHHRRPIIICDRADSLRIRDVCIGRAAQIYNKRLVRLDCGVAADRDIEYLRRLSGEERQQR